MYKSQLLASYAPWMTTWAIPQIRPDVTSAATPMTIMKEGTEEAFTSQPEGVWLHRSRSHQGDGLESLWQETEGAFP